MRTGCGVERGDENVRTLGRLLPPTAGAPGCDSSRRQPSLFDGPSSRTKLPDRTSLDRTFDLELLNRVAPGAPKLRAVVLRAGANGVPPLTTPARAISAELGRTKALRPTPARPKSAARRPVTAPLKRALR